ncbi:MAG TPA: ATP phosphoribosyltransferase regulatory subunit [Thermaerobacter sp.]
MEATDRELELAHRQEMAGERLARLFARWGYRRIRTPMWEEASHPAPPGLPDTSLCRFVDSAGRVLALRADHTPAVARWVAPRYGGGSSPWRLYYIDPVFRRDPRDGRFTTRLQAGVELIGAAQPWGDMEVIALLLQALDELGLEEARVAVGHTGLLRQLLEARGLGPGQQERACALLAARNLAGLRRFLEETLPGERAGELHALLAGGLSPAEAGEILQRLAGDDAAGFRRVLEALERLAPPGRVRVEFGLVRDLGYYTGMVFEAYAGCGRVATGGRYDTLLERYGGRGPATGFAFDLDQVAASLGDEPAAQPIDYLVAGHDVEALWVEAARLRRRGCSAVVAPGLPDEEAARAAALAQGCRRVLWLDGQRRSLRMAGQPVAAAAARDGAVTAIH